MFGMGEPGQALLQLERYHNSGRDEKVMANTEWEYIAGICSELIGTQKPILEVDTTNSNTEDLVLKIKEFIGNFDSLNSKYENIEIDWMKEPPNFG